MKTIKWKIDPSVKTMNWTTEQLIQAVAGTWKRFYEDVCNVAFRQVAWNQSADFSVKTKEIIYKGQHYRGIASGTTIWLHNGWYSAGNRWFTTPPFTSAAGVQQIAAHELGHLGTIGFGGTSSSHCKIPACTFHSNAGQMWCDSHRNKLVRKFGKRAPAAMAALDEAFGELLVND